MMSEEESPPTPLQVGLQKKNIIKKEKNVKKIMNNYGLRIIRCYRIKRKCNLTGTKVSRYGNRIKQNGNGTEQKWIVRYGNEPNETDTESKLS